jgi:hypothetical protein
VWRYYNVLGNIFKGQVSWDRAIDASLKLPLGERVDWLSRLERITAAVEDGQRMSMVSGSVGEWPLR